MADPAVPSTVSPPLPWWVVPGLAYTLLLAFIAISGIIVYRGDDKYEQMVIVALIALVTGATGYYFGSSSGSEKKSDAIATDSAAKSAALAISTPTSEPSDAAKALAAKLPPTA